MDGSPHVVRFDATTLWHFDAAEWAPSTASFSAAARRLNVGQPAVSKMVAQLEERLGVKLLVRTTRGLTATEAGLNYYERARRSIEEADEAELAARGAGSSLRGKLRVCAAVTFARIHLMPRLPEFLAQHPELEIEAVLDDRNIDLVHERIDVGLRMGRLADSTLTARRIASGPQVTMSLAPRSRAATTAAQSDRRRSVTGYEGSRKGRARFAAAANRSIGSPGNVGLVIIPAAN